MWAINSNKILCTFITIQLMCSSKNKKLPFLNITFTSETLLKQILKMFCMAMQFFQIKVGKKMLSSLRPSYTWPVSLIIIWFFTYGKSLYTIGKLYIALKFDNYFSCMQWDTVKFPEHFFLPNASNGSLWQMINPSWFWLSEVFSKSKILE